MVYIKVSLISLSLLSTILFSAIPDETSIHPNIKFQHISYKDGLPSTPLTMCHDHLGYIWFGCAHGACRFDGYEFKLFEARSDTVWPRTKRNVGICKDLDGNIWIAERHYGISMLNRRTGRYTHYVHDPNDSTTLSTNHIGGFFIDSHGYLWIACVKGPKYSPVIYLDRMDTRTGKVKRYRHDPDDKTTIGGDGVYIHGLYNLAKFNIIEDTQANLWVAIWNAGVSRYNRQSDTFTRFRHDPGDSTSLSSDVVRGMTCSKDDDIWICTANGVSRFSYETNVFQNYRHISGDSNSLSTNDCDFAFEDENNQMWISHLFGFDTIDLSSEKIVRIPHNFPSKGILNIRPYFPLYFDTHSCMWFAFAHDDINGLGYYDTKANVYHYFTDDRDNYDGLYLTWFYLSGVDPSNMIWIGSYDQILNKTNPNVNRFITLAKNENSPNSLLSNTIENMLESKIDSSIWLATPEGFSNYNWTTGQFEHFVNTPQNSNSLSYNNVTGFAEDNNGNLWITTFNGLNKLDSLGNFHHFYHKEGDSTTLSENRLLGLDYDDYGYLWIRMAFSGVNRLDLKTGRVKQFIKDTNDPTSLDILQQAYHVFKDRTGELWFATDRGLSKYNYEKENFTSIIQGVAPKRIIEDRWNNLWIGTFFNGVLRLNRESGECFRFQGNHPLAHCKVSDFVEDDDGSIWISTNRGLVKFFPPDGSYLLIQEEHGLPAAMDLTTGVKRHDGTIMWGTVSKGIIEFDPKTIQLDQNPPRVVISDIKISNESLQIGENSPLKQDISMTSELRLGHFQNDISFICSALHYVRPEKNQYAFWLENYDEDWYQTGTTRVATYTNLDPGRYIFHAKAANSDGIWNETGRSLDIFIRPPWYATVWAYIIYVIIIAGTVYTIWTTQLRRIRLRDALELQQVEAKKLHEIDSMKTRFLANISHEFRTPLTLILGPIDQLLTKINDGELLANIKMMRRNAQRLQRLVNQLLDLSKIEAGKLTLQARFDDIVPFINRVVQTFESQAKLKNITLTFFAEQESLIIYYDQEKMENILYNLVSNAIKFTPENERVSVSVKQNSIDSNTQNKNHALTGEIAEIVVKDTGKGIAAEHVNHIFNRFYQVDDNFASTDAGTGIGLSLTKELVELHRGHIHVKSTPGVGSEFTVYLPLGKEHVLEHETAQNEEQSVDRIESTKETEIVQSIDAEKINANAPTLLVVEDNADLRDYITSILDSHHTIKQAGNGRDGFEKTIKLLPDMVISDVMMPVMDGFELCKRIKSDQRISHIPVILLTARANMESKIQGLDLGADDYIIKPFNETELKIRVKNLIDQRQHLRERFGRDILTPLKDVTITSADERFLTRAVDIIGENLINSELGPDFLATRLGLSRSQLHRKLKAIVDLSTTEFIRTIRLRRAAELINNNFGSMAEIAYEVGFNNPAHFSRYFRSQFGCSPHEFRLNGNSERKPNT